MQGLLFILESYVTPDMDMAVEPWLNIKTLKQKYSVKVRERGTKVWAHIANGQTGRMRTFRTPQTANAFIEKLKK